MIKNYSTMLDSFAVPRHAESRNVKNSRTKMQSVWGVLVLFLLLALSPMSLQAQLITNYAFSTGTNGSLEDLSVGSTVLLTGNIDDGATVVTPIGFDFYFMGVKYTHFSANSNGQLRLHQNATQPAISTTSVTTPSANTPLLLPMAGDNEVNNGMRSKLVGGKLVVEWNQFYVHFANSLINAGNMQVWLDPSGKIDYVYGEIYNATNVAVSRSIAIASSNTATTSGYVTLAATPTFTAASAFVTNNFPAGSGTTTGSPLLANLGSNDNSSRRYFSFTPGTAPTAPTTLTFSLVQSASTSVSWVDNSVNEVSFTITRATDAAFTANVVNTFVASTTTTGTGTVYTAPQTGLLPSTTYYYKVVALSEGNVSPSVSGTTATTAPGTFVSIASGNFNAATTWDVNIVPSIYDSATIAPGHNVSVSATGLGINNLIVQGTLSYGTPTSFAVTGNLTVEPSGVVNAFATTTGKTLSVSGNIANNGIMDFSVGSGSEGLILNGSTVQTVSGSGSFNTNVIRNLAFNNTNTAIPNVNWQFNNIKIANNLDFTGSRVNLGTNKLTFGNNAAGGTLTAPAGTGLLTGAKFSRWWTATTTGASITAGADPTGTAGRYPFVGITGLSRSMWIARTNATGAVAGEIAVLYTDASGSTTGLTIADGSYTVNERYNGNWSVSNEGTAVSASSYVLAIVAPQAYSSSNGNSRISFAATPIGGTHQNGTSTPSAQRIAVTQADLFAAPLYIGSSSSDVPFVSIINGNWDSPATWNKNAVPTATDNVSIAANTTVATNGTNAAGTLTVLSGGSLNVTTGILSVTSNITNASGGTLNVNGGTLNLSVAGVNNRPFVNNGVLSVSSGTINVFGSLVNNASSSFNQSGGDIIIDGNNAGVAASSVPTGTNLLGFTTSLVSLTGGKITIVDPHVGTSTSDYSVYYLQAAMANATAGHTLQFGNGVSTDATTNTGGFIVDPYVGALRLNFGNMILNTTISTSNRFVTIPEGLGLHGGLTINAGSELRANGLYLFAIAGNIVNNGTLTSTIANLSFAGVDLATVTAVANPVAQSVSGTGVFRNATTAATANLSNLIVNHAPTAGLTLNVPLSVSGTLTLTNGLINTTSANMLSLGTTTAAGALVGGSATAYINGPFTRTIGTANTAYVAYPVGKTAYAPISLSPSTTTVATMKAEAFDSNAGTMDATIVDLNTTRRWEAPLLTGTATDVKVRIGDAGIIATSIPVQAPSVNGIYTAAFGQAATFAAGAPNTTQSIGAVTAANYTGFIGYAVSNTCSGTPAPGNTIASATSICFGSSVNLSLQNSIIGSGVTYVWESSADGTTFAPISGATSATFTTVPTAALYYRAQVTCSGSTGISAPVQVSFTNSITSTTPNSRCGAGTVSLGATGNTGSAVNWYDSAVNGTLVGTGPTFVTPVITATTNYYAVSETASAGIITSGTATTLTGATEQPTAFCNRWPVYLSQTIYTAAELSALGLRAGNITSMAYNITTLGDNATNPNFTVKIGSTTATNFANTTFLSATAYTSVYGPTTYTHTASGWQVINFTTPYVWDGISNIVINVSQQGSNQTNNSQTYYTATTDSKVLYSTSASPTTGTLSLNRLNTRFTGEVACASARVQVVATVTTPPALTLSATPAVICSGQSSTPVTLTSPIADYDTFAWSPATGVTGNSTSGWTFNPATSTLYTLTATQSTGSLCTTTATVTISVSQLPSVISISPSPAAVCENTVLPLVATGGTVIVNGKIGSGTATNTLSTPFKGNWGASKSQALYTASELFALGLQAGQRVSSIGYVSLSGTPLAFNNFTINAGFVGVSTIGSTFISGASTVVYGPATYTPATGTGNLDFTVTAPLIWDGVSSLLIETCYNNNNSGGATATSLSIESSTVATGLNLYRSQDNTPDACSNATAPTGTTNRPNLRITGVESTTLTWSPVTNLYSDAAATVPYVSGTNANTVYFKSNTAAAATTYTATSTTGQTCSRSASVDVTVNATQTPDFAAIPAFCSGSSAPTLASTSPNGITGTWSPATISNTANGTYVFTPNAGQCANSQTLSVTVTTTVTPDFATIPAICSGSTAPTLATVSPNGIIGTWSPATVSNMASGSYVFTPNAGQCASNQTLMVTVTTTAAPTGTSPQDYTTGETLADFDVTGTGIIWYDAPTAGNILPASTILVSNVTYYASQTVDGCESPTRLPITAGVNLKVDGFDAKSFKYYPNPVNDVLTISYSQEITGLKLFNIVGQQIFSKNVSATQTQLDMSNLPAGSYILEVTSGSDSKVVKLVKR